MSGLGKGLGALLDDAAVSAGSPANVNVSENLLPISALQPSDVQPRRYFDDSALKSLAGSIKSQGVLQPLLVRPLDGGKYEIIAGERRWRASQLAGLTDVPVIIRELDDGKALEVALVENIQRADLNPIDEAAGYLRLVNEFNYTHEDMARVTGKSRSHITNLMRLLSLPERIKESVTGGLLSMGHARALLGLNGDEATQLRVAKRVIKNNLSVRETEDLVRKLVDPNKKKRGRKVTDMATKELETRVSTSIGLKVSIQQESGTGNLRIHFEGQDQMKALIDKLCG
jgi:ParB family chromosome partitioning protein